MGLALDEPKDNDRVFEKGELKFLVEDALVEQCGVITVDFIDAGHRSGFAVSSEKPLSDGKNSCSIGGCSGCG